MAEETAHRPAGGSPGEPGDKKGLKTKNTKWYVIGGLAVVAVLVFFFVKQSNSNAANSASATPNSTTLDPSTEAALQAALQNQANGAGGGAVAGPAGSTGPAGPAGPTGPTGKTGAPGKAGAPGKSGSPGTPGKPGHSGGGTGGHTSSSYTVKAGDSLSAIAARFHLSNWQQLYNANRSVVGGNPNLIHPGQRLTIP